jgi:calcineurin-like phosphoesterase family protein
MDARVKPAHDESKMTVWFTGDTHFGHGGALGRFKRPFRSVIEMDETLIARWNDRVGAHDEVWHLGDFAYRMQAERMAHVLARLNGVKHLVTGNNDGADTMSLTGWSSVQAYREMELEGVRLVLCHYPFRTWNGMYKGAYNLHGHSHGQLAGLTRQIDVGVDVWDYRPITLDAIRTRKRRA